MKPITANTAIKASELDTQEKFDTALNCFEKAGFPTEMSRAHYPNKYNRAHFGMGNWFVAFLDESMPREIITLDELIQRSLFKG